MSKIFMRVEKPHPEIEQQTNWINTLAIAMVTKKTRGDMTHVRILWQSGKTTEIQGSDAKAFLEQWEPT